MTVTLTHQESSRRSILRPLRSSHTTTPPNAFGVIDPSINTGWEVASPSSTEPVTNHSTTTLVSDDEDNDVMDNFNHSFDQIEHTVRVSKERGDRYKQSYVAARKELSSLRLGQAEALRELDEARMMVVEQVKKNGRLEAEKDQVLRDLRESTASRTMSKDEKTMDGLTKAKEKAENSVENLQRAAKGGHEHHQRLTQSSRLFTDGARV